MVTKSYQNHEAVTNRDTERKKERVEQKDQIRQSAPPAGVAGKCEDFESIVITATTMPQHPDG